jgi:hypothetical protein
MIHSAFKAIALAAATLIGISAHADSGSFACISNAASCTAAADNDISWAYDGSTFTITNGGPSTWFIGQVYFDFASATPVSFAGGVGTAVHSGASPAALPGGAAYTIGAAGWASSWGANASPSLHGINGGESASWTFASTDYVAGIHLQGVPLGTATTGASLIAITAVPEPETYALMLAGLGAMAFMARRRRRA